MKLYKYMALHPFAHEADILLGRRFHTAQFFDLNDPMEGLFSYPPQTKDEYLERLRIGKETLRICAFSKDWRNPVLWAHYADGFRGVCIEVEVTKPYPQGIQFQPVEYSYERWHFNDNMAPGIEVLPNFFLTSKARQWRMEQEVRALAAAEYLPLGSHLVITRVLLGLRTDAGLRQVIGQMTPPAVSVWTTKIGDTKNVIEIDARATPPAQPYNMEA